MKLLSEKLSIGIDLVEVGRFADIKEKEQFLKNVFTEKELKDCKKKNNSAESLAARFAVKEAVRKSLKESLKFNEIEVTNRKDGSPKAVFLNKKIKQKYKSLISITHTKQFAQAVCLTFRK